MAFLINMMGGVKSFIWGSHQETQNAAQTPLEVFEENLSSFSEMSIDRSKCVENCIQSVIDLLQPEDYNLSDTSQKIIEGYLEGFNQIVDKTSYLMESETLALKADFKSSLCNVAEEKWAVFMAKSFYPISSISNADEQVEAAQKWTHQYFLGVDYFNEWEGSYTFIQAEFVAKLQQKTSLALRAYAQEMNQKKIQAMQAKAERDPVSFEKKMVEVEAKREKDPTSLFSSEKEYIEFTEILASCVTLYWPEIDKKIELLQKCIWNGYTFQKFKEPILGSDAPQRLFTDTFKKA
jgi:hypothetical protein